MPNHNMTYEDYLQMFGTKEQLDEYRIKQSELREWIEENIPVYKPQNRFFDCTGAGGRMKNRLIGIAVLLLLGFILFLCLSGIGMLVAVVFLVMHPASIVLGTIVSAFMVLLHLMMKEK